ncbi:hypothetical protein ACP275_02G123400 [Erythranthe tilingii]
MAITNTNLMVVATIMIIIAMKTQFTFAQLAPPPTTPPLKQRCNDMFNFVKTCAIYMHRFSPWFHKPNEKCCENARKVNISLFCKIFLISEVENVFNPHKVAVIARHCNNPLPRFSKCGSYFVRRMELTTQNDKSVNFRAFNMTSSEIDADNNNFCH